jgi:nitroimidazol reductase NimA-like FMN-containing flavoprotein (pyridoxamine 5'-phosphate oxidase superfamily)
MRREKASVSTPAMMLRLKTLILRLLDEHRVMTLATNRPDGWPQATMVGYVNDGYLLYCFVARNTQKYANILRDPRISLTIGSDAADPAEIKGLSLAGRAAEVTDRTEFDDVAKLRLRKYPEYATALARVHDGDNALRVQPQPPASRVALLRIAPDIISVLDYSQGFGHSELVTFSERGLDVHIDSMRHPWNGIHSG